MKILVTGAAGFVGSNLVDGLLSAGHELRALDNFSTGQRSNLAHVTDDIDLVEGDLRSYERVSWAVRGCEAVFHEGAMPSVPRSVQDPLTSSEINIGGTLNVLLAARDAGVRRVVFASSSSVYGDAPGLPRVETQATSPLRAVRGLQARRRAVLPRRAPRLRPRDRLPALLQRVRPPPGSVLAVQRRDPEVHHGDARRASAPAIYGDGTQSRDFTHIDDVVAANILALDAVPAAGRIYNIACGRQVSLNELVAQLNEILGTQLDADYLDPRPGDVKHSLADVGRAERELGFKAAVGFAQGLRHTIEAYEPGSVEV